MSNTRKLRQLNPGSGQMARPKNTWRGYRPSRSVYKQRQFDLMVARARKAVRRLTLPKQPEPAPCTEPVCQASASTGVVMTPWQHDLMHKLAKEENVA